MRLTDFRIYFSPILLHTDGIMYASTAGQIRPDVYSRLYVSHEVASSTSARGSHARSLVSIYVYKVRTESLAHPFTCKVQMHTCSWPPAQTSSRPATILDCTQPLYQPSACRPCCLVVSAHQRPLIRRHLQQILRQLCNLDPQPPRKGL